MSMSISKTKYCRRGAMLEAFVSARPLARTRAQSRTLPLRRSSSRDAKSACLPAGSSPEEWRFVRARAGSGDPHHAGASRQSGSPGDIRGQCSSTGGVLVRVDILHRRRDGRWRLIEVKSTTDVQGPPSRRRRIQYRVVSRSGVDVASACLAHVNRNYVYRGRGHRS